MALWQIRRASAPAIIEDGSTPSVKSSTCGDGTSTPQKPKRRTVAPTVIAGALRAELVAGELTCAHTDRERTSSTARETAQRTAGVAIVSSVVTPNCLNSP
jgi:hypothetical protein